MQCMPNDRKCNSIGHSRAPTPPLAHFSPHLRESHGSPLAGLGGVTGSGPMDPSHRPATPLHSRRAADVARLELYLIAFAWKLHITEWNQVSDTILLSIIFGVRSAVFALPLTHISLSLLWWLIGPQGYTPIRRSHQLIVCNNVRCCSPLTLNLCQLFDEHIYVALSEWSMRYDSLFANEASFWKLTTSAKTATSCSSVNRRVAQ